MKMLLNIIGLVLAVYLLLCLALYVLQDTLIFHPPQADESQYKRFESHQLWIEQAPINLHGWKIEIDKSYKKTLLYFGGNAEDVIGFNEEAKNFNVQQAFTFNYPGYGKSQGKPSQKSLYAASLLIYDELVNQYKINPDDIIIVGRSLGSSVATYLASQRKHAALVLITPFDSMEHIAKRRYGFFPTSILLKHAFPSKTYIKNVNSKILMLAAQRDEIIPDIHLQLLHSAASNARLIQYKEVGHNTIQNDRQYYSDINQFVNDFLY